LRIICALKVLSSALRPQYAHKVLPNRGTAVMQLMRGKTTSAHRRLQKDSDLALAKHCEINGDTLNRFEGATE
jgi:hypothetical protein